MIASATPRALDLAQAHHAAIGPAWRDALNGSDTVPVIAAWAQMPILTQSVMTNVMARLLAERAVIDPVELATVIDLRIERARAQGDAWLDGSLDRAILALQEVRVELLGERLA